MPPLPPHSRPRVRVVAAIAIAGIAACGESPVAWNEMRAAKTQGGSALSPDGTFLTDSMAMLAERVAPPDPSVCPGSLVLAHAGRRLYAAWWSVRPDSSALLLAAHSDNAGRAWSAPAPIDTTDQSVSGCRRAPPAIAADSSSGYVHLVFALLGREGPGLFYAHSMDA